VSWRQRLKHNDRAADVTQTIDANDADGSERSSRFASPMEDNAQIIYASLADKITPCPAPSTSPTRLSPRSGCLRWVAQSCCEDPDGVSSSHCIGTRRALFARQAQRLRPVFLRSQKPLFSKGLRASTKALSTLTNQYSALPDRCFSWFSRGNC
jgi:hypothetical protein